MTGDNCWTHVARTTATLLPSPLIYVVYRVRDLPHHGYTTTPTARYHPHLLCRTVFTRPPQHVYGYLLHPTPPPRLVSTRLRGDSLPGVLTLRMVQVNSFPVDMTLCDVVRGHSAGSRFGRRRTIHGLDRRSFTVGRLPFCTPVDIPPFVPRLDLTRLTTFIYGPVVGSFLCVRCPELPHTTDSTTPDGGYRQPSTSPLPFG